MNDDGNKQREDGKAPLSQPFTVYDFTIEQMAFIRSLQESYRMTRQEMMQAIQYYLGQETDPETGEMMNSAIAILDSMSDSDYEDYNFEVDFDEIRE